MLKVILGIPNRKGISTRNLLRFRVGSHLEFECRLVLPTCSSDGSISMVELSWEPNRTSSKKSKLFFVTKSRYPNLFLTFVAWFINFPGCFFRRWSNSPISREIAFLLPKPEIVLNSQSRSFEDHLLMNIVIYCCTWWFCWGNPAAKLLKNIPKYSQSFNPSGANFLHFFF